MNREIRVGIVEDQRHTREGLATLVNGTAGYRTVGAWNSMEAALARVEADPPDVMLVDIMLPGMSGIDGVRLLKAQYPALQILMLTVYTANELVFEAICAGACGYLLKDTPPTRLLEAIREVCDGGAPMSAEIARKVVTMFQSIGTPKKDEEPGLSLREFQVLKLLAEGHSYKTAANELSVSIDTLRFHVRNIYEKLHVHSKSEALLKAFRSGIIH
ncbi:MAG TPA: response regulator transcription factor [Vicinamibacterales bacterium]|nr:response regulator transcription factor [Vicinamibacterales bacterium]